ncbi:MAG: hypothetical protein OXR66_01345 [Candidatus Woesearchaeota archaeon]|nr:hypothetical protein [Candidatus Woesearchaeota archaeon]
MPSQNAIHVPHEGTRVEQELLILPEDVISKMTQQAHEKGELRYNGENLNVQDIAAFARYLATRTLHEQHNNSKPSVKEQHMIGDSSTSMWLKQVSENQCGRIKI